MLLAIDDHKRRIEVGSGLEGILNDAKVGDIGRAMVRPRVSTATPALSEEMEATQAAPAAVGKLCIFSLRLHSTKPSIDMTMKNA